MSKGRRAAGKGEQWWLRATCVSRASRLQIPISVSAGHHHDVTDKSATSCSPQLSISRPFRRSARRPRLPRLDSGFPRTLYGQRQIVIQDKRGTDPSLIQGHVTTRYSARRRTARVRLSRSTPPRLRMLACILPQFDCTSPFSSQRPYQTLLRRFAT